MGSRNSQRARQQPEDDAPARWPNNVRVNAGAVIRFIDTLRPINAFAPSAKKVPIGLV
jgi:hypothetical protein